MKVQKTKRLIGKERLLNILAARFCAYAFLRRAFLEEPVKEYLELLAGGDILGYFPKVEQNALIESGYETLMFFLKDPDLLTEEMLIELIADYTSLFIGPGKLGAAPYESVYRSNKPLVFQEHTMEVRDEYAKHDLIPERFQQEPDDHIGLELDFMLRLTEKCMKEIRAKRFSKAKSLLRAQKRFLDDHLMKWVPKFTENMGKNARTDFYRGISKMLAGYLEIDKVLVASLVEELGERVKREKAKRSLKAV